MVLLLEIARGLAALWVFLFHTSDFFVDSELLYNIAIYGHLGVPMFFVISGFVITYSAEATLKANRSPVSFLKKRFLRIYPVFWVSIVVVILLPYFIEFISMLKSGRFYSPDNLLWEYTVNEWLHFVLLSKVFFAESSNLQFQFSAINAVYWTIAIEFQFYLVIFISMFFKNYYKHVVVGVTLIAFVNIYLSLGLNYGLFIHYWPSFSVGILLAYVFKSGYDFSSIVKNGHQKLMVFTIIFISMLLYVVFTEGQIVGLSFAVVFGILLWCMSPVESTLLKLKKKKKSVSSYVIECFVALGAMSYSVYLLHGKLYGLSEMFVRQVLEQNTILYGFVILFLTLLICYPFYLFVERPFMSKGHVDMHKKRHLSGNERGIIEGQSDTRKHIQ